MRKQYRVVDGELVEIPFDPDLWRPKEEPDKQFYDITWQRYDPFFEFHEKGTWFEEFIDVTPSDRHFMEYPHPSRIGTAISARVAANNEEEALEAFWKIWAHSPYANEWSHD